MTEESDYVHFSIQIGKRIVHWHKTGLVLLNRIKNSKCLAVFSAHLNGEEVESIPNTEENKLKICKTIQKWNCIKEHCVKSANCQTFAKELLESVGLELNPKCSQKSIVDFLGYLKSNHSQEHPHPFIVRNGEKLIEWKSHQELDLWQNTLGQKYQDYSTLLMGFHRAFQMNKQTGKDCILK